MGCQGRFLQRRKPRRRARSGSPFDPGAGCEDTQWPAHTPVRPHVSLVHRRKIPMVQIDVIFLPTGATPEDRTKVNPEPASAHLNDWVSWTFRAFDDEIDSVQIEFDHDAESYFFPRGGGPPFKSLKTDLISGGATIWGRAPDLGVGSFPSKYTIKAFDKHNHVIDEYTLDPQVITEQP